MNLHTGTFAGAGFDASPHVPLNPFDQHQMTRQLQNIMQFQLIKNISTGNFIIDTIIQVIMMAMVTYCVTQIKSILDWIFMWVGRFYTWVERKVRIRISQWRGTVPQFTKTVEIPFISDSRQINELYKAVHWFLSSNTEIDYIKESSLQYVYEKKLDSTQNDSILSAFPISKILNQNKSKKIMYKGHQIYFLFETETITIYTDKEKKRDNFRVKLWTQIDENTKTDILEEFSQMCVVKYLESLKASVWKQQIFVNKGNTWEGSDSKNVRKLDTVVLPKDIKDEIKDDMELFLNSEEWYLHRDIPYTRGYLLYGLPGTGKTSLIKALSLHYKKHISYLVLNSVESDNQLIELLQLVNYKTTILIIEDIDAMIDLVKSREENAPQEALISSDDSEDYVVEKKKTSKTSKTKKQDSEVKVKSTLTFSGILNAIDGVFNAHGRIMFMTTNKPEILDQALIRAGRCDVRKQFSFCDRKQVQELFHMFFEKEAPHEQIESIKQYAYSPAHISSIFMRYRNAPDQALIHLDDIEQKVSIKSMID
jgi:hypothetical protein